MVFLRNFFGVPGEEFGNGVGAEDGGSIAIGDTGDIGMQIIIGDDRHEFLEGVAVGLAVEAVPL